MRALLAILVGLPMLMPPGMCICQLLPCAAAASTTDRKADSPSPETCACRKHVASQTCTTGQETRTSSTNDDHPLGPVPYKHSPGCPAAQSADQSKLVQSQRLTLNEGSTALMAFELPVVESPRFNSLQARCFRPAETPIYLSHLTLLI